MTTIHLADVTYHVTLAGNGPAVAFLHGFTGSGAEWAPFTDAQAIARTAVTIDLLGHGASSRPTDPDRYDLARQAADLAAVIERLDLGPAAVIGYSYGARIALQLTVDRPALVTGLVLESASAGIPDAEDRAARLAADGALAADLERDGIDVFADRWEAMPMFAGERRLPDPVREDLSRRRRTNDPAALAAALRGAGHGAMTPLHDRLVGIGAPTAVLAGAADPTGLARARIVAAGIPGATLEVFADVGHAPHREVPDRFAAWLAASVDRISTASSPILVPSSQRRSAP